MNTGLSHRAVILPSETDLDAFRTEARRLLAAGVPPAAVEWHVAGAVAGDLFADVSDPAADDGLPGPRPPAADPATPRNLPLFTDLDPGMDTDASPEGTVGSAPAKASRPSERPASTARVPPEFLALCQQVILHADPGRFGLLYRLLWRLVHEPGLRHDPLDPDMLQAEQMAKAVRRDIHKMHAFVRFREVDDGGGASGGAGPLHVAWFEPGHHIVEATAAFFQRRFTGMRWAILTPGRSIAWDGRRLTLGPGGRREDAPPADAGEVLWLTYYAHIFNPARLKLAMMQKEMPRRYWHNLPEARLIGELSAQALERSAAMIAKASTTPARRISAAGRAPLHPDHPAQAVHDAPNGAAAVPIRSIAQLKAATDRCRECPIGAHATQSVAGVGPLGARLMVVGEQPGDQEDLHGRPFVGPAGRLFDRALAELDWSRDTLFVTNAVRHFKYELRGKRRIHKTPGQREAAACLHWLEDEIDLVAPRALLALGATAARAVLGRPVAVTQERGVWIDGGLRGLPVLVTLHPSALLRADPAHGEENFARWLDDLRQAERVLAGA
ncbi:UdgX family uracil-DNA binding protein [uncultured Xylophilus sp.]|uniref:UdgX family uracil-DNA binding protein n=1 Tax=uncultured Xylophilus sp. TaxID=296832 RepID=UPI0025E02524|nr:UdgX family uracil-DNA binding protein [uncultured Xylophilus sp.]